MGVPSRVFVTPDGYIRVLFLTLFVLNSMISKMLEQ